MPVAIQTGEHALELLNHLLESQPFVNSTLVSPSANPHDIASLLYNDSSVSITDYSTQVADSLLLASNEIVTPSTALVTPTCESFAVASDICPNNPYALQIYQSGWSLGGMLSSFGEMLSQSVNTVCNTAAAGKEIAEQYLFDSTEAIAETASKLYRDTSTYAASIYGSSTDYAASLYSSSTDYAANLYSSSTEYTASLYSNGSEYAANLYNTGSTYAANCIPSTETILANTTGLLPSAAVAGQALLNTAEMALVSTIVASGVLVTAGLAIGIGNTAYEAIKAKPWTSLFNEERKNKNERKQNLPSSRKPNHKHRPKAS